MTHWALLDYTLTPIASQVIITGHTSRAAHLYAHYTNQEPVRTLLPRIRRGLQIFCYPRWAFTSQGYIEQTEPGETIEHTFDFTPWASCITLWILLSAQTDLTIKDSSGPILKYHNYFLGILSIGEYSDPILLTGAVKLEAGTGITITRDDAHNSLIITRT